MRPYTALCSSVLFPLHERLKGHLSVATLRRLEASQWSSPNDLDRYRTRRLRDLLEAASSRVPYYRSIVQGVQDLGRGSMTEMLERIPFLTKSIIREQGDRMRAEGACGLKRLSTGGSTGEPLTFWVGRDRISHDVAAKWRATRWWGVDIGDPEIVLWGSPIELGAQDRARWLRDRIFRTHLLPAFRMSTEQMTQHLLTVRRVRPTMLFGYPSALALLADHARNSAMHMDDLGVRVAFCTGETLLPSHRESIESVFGAPVANGYGSRDAGFLAHQCPRGSLHLSAEDVIVEVIDEQGKPQAAGTEGELVVTHLATADFPMIRYRTGDIGSLSDSTCSCGRTLPVLSSVRGRSTDMIRTADGNTMHALALIYVLRECPGVASFKIVQKTLSSIHVHVVPGPGFGPQTTSAIRSGLALRVGDRTTIHVESVARIEPERSGKYRYVVSEVP